MESKLSLNHFCCNLKALPSLARLISHLFCSGLSIWVSPCVKPEPSVTDDVHGGVLVLTAPMGRDGGAQLSPTVGSVPRSPHLPSFRGSLQLLGGVM